MKFYAALRISYSLKLDSRTRTIEPIAFVGAGGKSTAMFQLARELPPPVVVSATTHLGKWQISLADKHYILPGHETLEQDFLAKGITLVTGGIEEDRTRGLGANAIRWLHEMCKLSSIPLLIEADGSREKPIKAPGEHEPSIPDFVNTVVVSAGLSGLDHTLDSETVHRPEIFAQVSGLQIGNAITPEAIVRMLTQMKGGLKNIPEKARRIALLNQADSPELQSRANSMARDILARYQSVIVASLQAQQIHAVHEPIAGIVLAAGEAKRFGKPKQLLEWRSEPFVRAVAKMALKAGLSPVKVIIGAYAERVETAVKDLPVQIVHNDKWKSGQAASIKAGLASLADLQKSLDVGGAIFFLADQPQITPMIIEALVENHASTLAPITAPMVLDQRSNPVLFDRVTFPDLMRLEGDVGGRGIFSKYKVTYLPWHDDAMLLDVDTPEQYQRLKDLLE